VAGKTRLDDYLVEHGLAADRSIAQRLAMAGQVRVNGQVVLNGSTLVERQASVTIEHGPRFVSRGGEKLEAALQAFQVPVKEKICADVGASTGGFTDCLLQAGASQVYAIDVGTGILDWRLRQDLRVVVMEGTNARHVTTLPQQISLVTIDASFISLKVLLPVVKGWLTGGLAGGLAGGLDDRARLVALVKPQFEAGRAQAARGRGVIRDPHLHEQVLLDVLHFAVGECFDVLGLIQSPLLGPKGNAEFLVYLAYPGNGHGDVDTLVSTVFKFSA
jgi:23S rRNA (cytidine1920-2'-O)/16S rRNA (cytidine1409-2'-O)-methyltransferase